MTELLDFEINETNLPIRREQVIARIELYPTMIGSMVLLIPLLVWLMWGLVEQSILLGSLALIYIAHTSEMYNWWRFRDDVKTIDEVRRWDGRFRLQTGVGALAWSIACVLMFVPGDLGYQALLICVVLGITAGAVTINPMHRPSLFIMIGFLLLPFVVRVAMENDRTHWIIVFMLMIYIGFLMNSAIKLMRTFELSLQQRFEKEDLLHFLHEREKEAVEAMKKAEQANQAKSKFLATASHDLRQPLQALRLFSDALPGTTKEPEALRLAGQIGKSVNALVDMFDDLLDVSRMDAGIVRIHRKHFALFPLFDRLYADFAPLAHVKALDLILPVDEMDGEGGGPLAFSDPVLLERLLRNLISNAIRYTDSGSVEVKIRHIDGNMWLEVVDTGIGISPEAVPHIFEEYYQADNPHRDRRKGLGLGLAIVRRIEGILGCRVTVRSIPGAGSSFTFAVPAGDPALLVKPFSISHSNHDLKGVVVALVEDDPDIREFVAKLMDQWGCRVFAGEIGDDVIRKLDMAEVRPLPQSAGYAITSDLASVVGSPSRMASSSTSNVPAGGRPMGSPLLCSDPCALSGVRPDLLVCDYRLPHGMTAIQVIRRMRELWGNDLPALVLTGDTATETLHEIHSSGAMLLHKPISPARLRSTMYFALHSED